MDHLVKNTAIAIASLFLAALALTPWPVHAQTLIDSAERLRQSIDKTEAGEEFIIAPGIYEFTDLKLRRDISLRGQGEVIFQSTQAVAKGILNPMAGVSIRVENITFRNAHSPDQNGAGIRHDGKDLTVINCTFENNEDGILSTGDENGHIRIRESKFLRNGFGDGYSHGIYVVRAESLKISDSHFIGTRIGHHVKSLASKTQISGTTFDDAQGRTSYALDASKGGDITLTRNHFTQRGNAENPTLINYDLTRGGEASSITISDNIITNHHPRGKLLRNQTSVIPLVFGNDLINKDRGRLSYPQSDGPTQQNHTDIEARALTPLSFALEKSASKQAKKMGTLHAPEFNRAFPALAHFKLENNWSENSTLDYFTFGQSFAEGAFQKTDSLDVKFGDRQTPAQIDIKALHQDGSVRHGVVTIETPALAKGKAIDGALVKSINPKAPTPAASLSFSNIADRLNAPLNLTFHFKEEAAQNFSINLQELMSDEAINSATDFWLNGPLVKEFRKTVTAAPHLSLQFDVRLYRDDDIRVSIAYINQKSFASGRRDSLYDVAIGDAFSMEKVAHHRAANWRRIFWAGTQPRLHMIHDLETLVTSKAVLPLDTSLGVNATTVANNDDTLQDLAPFSKALLQPYMPSTGGRPDIGPYTQWVSNYLLAQTEAAKRVMLASAETAGAVPWHFTDDATGAPISIEDHPKFWADERGLEEQYSPGQPNADIFASSDGGWTPDHAHKPALTSIPYLVTGDHYYADELAMQAAWAVFGRWPVLREGGVKAIDVEQVRASAWSLRDLSDAAFLLPDMHPSKAYLTRALRQNLRLSATKYVDQRFMKNAGELEGYFEELIEREPERITPWSNDYMAISLWLAAERGEPDAQSLLSWSANFHARRFITPTFDFLRGSSYKFPAKDAQTQTPVSRWSALADKFTEDTQSPFLMEGYPDLAYGYIGSGLAAITAIASGTGSPAALEAAALILRESKSYPLWEFGVGSVRRYNNFLFTLTAPNGETYSRNNISWKKNAKNNSALILGNSGNDELQGGNKNDALFGLSGNDIISGGPGNDYLGGGPGSDSLSGGPGADIFAFAQNDGSADIITDFDPQQDQIHIARYTVTSPLFLDQDIKDTPQGALFTYPDGIGSIVFKGISAEILTRENLVILR